MALVCGRLLFLLLLMVGWKNATLACIISWFGTLRKIVQRIASLSGAEFHPQDLGIIVNPIADHILLGILPEYLLYIGLRYPLFGFAVHFAGMSGTFSTTFEHQLLLDTIDKLRAFGLSRYVDIPEIIVCGEQSSGKSATMEALSGFAFPTKDNFCTRFATEVVLRRHIEEKIKISITPSPEASKDHRSVLENFRVSVTAVDQDLGSIIDQAKTTMGISDSKVFSTDILRIEITGPSQPHLTLVDLPGIFRAGNREQSLQDSHTVRKLVRSYMEKPRSIILTVVSAKSDFNLQEATELARELDPQGSRTLGLITKPDTLDPGSNSESAFVNLACNKDVEFRLGWHVVRNRSYEARNTSLAERHEAETSFFRTGIWTNVDPKIVGVDNLRQRLSDVLRNQIIQELPGLLGDIQARMKDCSQRLEELGDPRDSIVEQRRYLLRISQDFVSLVSASISGLYNDEYFGDPLTNEGQERRLRAVIQNSLTEFERRIRLEGRTLEILEEVNSKKKLESNQISRKDYLEIVRNVMKHSRGCELPGTFNPLIIGHLFKEQCRPWNDLVLKLESDILLAVYRSMESVIEHLAPGESVESLKKLVRRNLKRLKDGLQAKVAELSHAYCYVHPITYNHYLTEQVQDMQERRRKKILEDKLKRAFNISRLKRSVVIDGSFNFVSILENLTENHEADMDKHSASMAADYMQAYYKVTIQCLRETRLTRTVGCPQEVHR